jgi:ATP-dependent Clp protease ATP-binding subunit ClpC
LVVIATSNAGSGRWRNEGPGFHDGTVAAAAQLKGLSERLRPFFRFEMLNRFDEIVPFAPLGREHGRALVQRLFAELEKRPGLARLGIHLEVSEAAVDWLLDRGFDPRNGVRYLRRTVERELGTRLAEVLVGEEVAPGETLRVRLEGDALRIQRFRAAAAPEASAEFSRRH